MDTVKERKQEIWGKVNLSLTPWPTTMCYPLREVSQTDGEREKRPGRGQKTVQLHLVRREREKNGQQK